MLSIKNKAGHSTHVDVTDDELVSIYETIKPIVRTLRSERRRRAINEAKALAMSEVE